MSTRARWGCAAVIAAMLAGCTGHGEPVDAPSWAGGASGRSAPTVTGERMLPEMFGDGAMTRSYEAGSGEGVTITTERRGERLFVVTERAGEEAFSESEIEVTESGVVLTRITNHDRETITDFRPPMLLMPMRAEAGFTIEQKLMMIVRPMDDPTKIKSRGTATYTLEYAGVSSVALAGGGVVEGASFVERLEASFPGASVMNVTRKWYADGAGMIARQAEESVSVLGLPAEKTVREVRRVE